MAFTEIALIYERHSPPIRLTVVTGNGSVREKKKRKKKVPVESTGVDGKTVNGPPSISRRIARRRGVY